MQVHGLHYFIVIDYFSLKLEEGLKVKWKKNNKFFLFFVSPLPWQSLKGSNLSQIWAKVFFFKGFVKSEQLQRLLNDQNDWYNV